MNLAEIKKLLKLVEESNIEEIEIQQDTFQIRIKKDLGQSVHLPRQQVQPVPMQPIPIQPAVLPDAGPEISSSSSENLIEICSPMVGTFYRAPATDAEPYINVGDTIHPGNILCIVEAMKLMNEIEAEVSGKIIQILVENAQPVEYNQPLFLVKKT